MIDVERNPMFLNKFLDYQAVTLNKSPNSVKEYNYDLIRFLKYISYKKKMTDKKSFDEIEIHDFPESALNSVTEDDIQSYLFYMSNTYSSKPATISRKASTIRIFFKFLYRKKIIDNNPSLEIETPKREKRLPKYLSLAESKKLLTSIETDEKDRNKERDFAIITIFLNCGIRLSELVGINISNIDFTENKMTVIGKGNKERTIYFNDSCISAIKAYLGVRPPKSKIKEPYQDALFLSERLERISTRTVQHIVKLELKKAGLDTRKYSVHKLRHTAATLMYQYGQVDIRALQELLGHESISTTQIYTHVENEQVRNAVKANPLSDFGKN